MTDSCEPECFEEAMQRETRKKWEQGMDEEMGSLVRNQTWDLVKLPAEKKGIAELMGLQVEGRRWRQEAVQG